MVQVRKAIWFFTGLSVFLFLAVVFVLCGFNRLTSDDFCHLWLVTDLGILESIYWWYHHWSGRWASLTFQLLVPLLSKKSASLQLFSTVTFLAWIGISILLSGTLLKKIPLVRRVILSLTTLEALFFLSPHPGETWFWASSVTHILWPSLLILVVVLAFFRRRQRVYQYVGYTSSLLLSSGHECVSLPFLGLLTFGIFLVTYLPNDSQDRNKDRVFLIYCLLLGAGSFGINLLAPGNTIRANHFGSPSFGQALFSSISCGAIISKRIVVDGAAELALIFCLSLMSSSHIPFRSISGRNLFYSVTVLLLGITIVVILNTFPGAYILHNAPPARAQFVIIVTFVLASIWTGYTLGSHFCLNRTQETVVIALFLVTFIACEKERWSKLIPSLEQGREYSMAFDDRYQALQEASGSNSRHKLSLKSLPPSGLIFSGTFSKNAKYSVNRWASAALKTPPIGFD